MNSKILILLLFIISCEKDDLQTNNKNYMSNPYLKEFYAENFIRYTDNPSDSLRQKLITINHFKEAIRFYESYEPNVVVNNVKNYISVNKKLFYHHENSPQLIVNFNFNFQKINQTSNNYILANVQAEEIVLQPELFRYKYKSHNFDYTIDFENAKLYSKFNIDYNIGYHSSQGDYIFEGFLPFRLDSITYDGSNMKFRMEESNLFDTSSGEKFIFE